MPLRESELRRQIQRYINRFTYSYSRWYVGISEDPRRRLFADHNVDEQRGLWGIWEAYTTNVARRVEAHFISLGTDGGTGGGDEDAVFVYAYKKTAATVP